VLVKETPSAPRWIRRDFEWYKDSKYHFTGAAMAVAGKANKDYILKAGSVALDEQIFITGLPRYDAWLDIHTDISYQNRKYITLLTFSQGYDADNTFIQVLSLFVALAEKLSNEQFLIKCKDAEDFNYVRTLIDVQDVLANLTIDYQVDLFDILPNSKVTIGYNSLSLFEAAIAKTQMIIPAWGECRYRGDGAMCSLDNKDVTELIDFAFTPNEFSRKIERSAQNLHLPDDERVLRFINMNNYLYFPTSSTCSDEFVKFVNKFID